MYQDPYEVVLSEKSTFPAYQYPEIPYCIIPIYYMSAAAGGGQRQLYP